MCQLDHAGPEDGSQRSEVRLDRQFEMSLNGWVKRLGFWGLVFFLLKGLLWLTIPVLIAIFAD